MNSNNLCIGAYAGSLLTTESHCILIGDNAQATPGKDSQIVVRFTDETEFRADLPAGKEIDLQSAVETLASVGAGNTHLGPTPELEAQWKEAKKNRAFGVKALLADTNGNQSYHP